MRSRWYVASGSPSRPSKRRRILPNLGSMTTPPPQPAAPAGTCDGYDPAQAAHRQQPVAEGFGADAGQYDRARPSYPAELVARIVAASPGRDVLDVGCGTGISSRLFSSAGCRVLGVDPDPRMAELARRGGTEVEVATFEDWDPAGRVFDAAVAAQSWHWVDPVARAAKAAAVLRPGRRLATFWNAFDPPERLRARCGRVAESLRQTGAFGEPEEWLSHWERPYTGGWRPVAMVSRARLRRGQARGMPA